MFSLHTENEVVAVTTAPIPIAPAKPKLQPLAGMIDVTKAALDTPSAPPLPLPAIRPQPVASLQAPQANVRSTVYAAEGKPNSPWAGGAARIAAKQPAAPRLDLGTPAGLPEAEGGIESVRKLLFGQHMAELQTKVAELQLALNGEMRRLRDALVGRVDEMAGYLHRDMVVLREEMNGEMAQLKADLFTAATGLSSVKDRLLVVESKSREDTATAIAEIENRLTRQESAFATALDNLERKFAGTLDSKCAEALAGLVRKSEVSDLLANLGSLVEQEQPGVELGWFSATPFVAQTPADSWASLAAGGGGGGATANDWQQGVNPFMAEESPVT